MPACAICQSSSARTRSARPEWTADLLAELSRVKDVVLWGSNPVDADSRADYFDSMFHATAVVGLNTSALVESAIVDRPVFTILLPEFRESQEGTFPPTISLTPHTGFSTSRVRSPSTRSSWQVSASGGAVRSNRRFVEHFVRPWCRDGRDTGVC